MNSALLSTETKKFIAAQGYDLREAGHKKTIKSKPGISGFQTGIFLIAGLLLLFLGLAFELLYVLGALVMLVPFVKYLLRKRFVYEFDVESGIFEIRDFLNPRTKRVFTFGEILGVDVNHYVLNTDASAFSESNKLYNYEVVLKAGKREYELFYFSEREYNPQPQVLAIRSVISNWLLPVAA